MIKTVKALAIIITFALTFISCSPKPSEVVKKYESAFNSHNVNKFTSLFTDNAVIELSLLYHLKGKNQIRGYAEYDSVLSSQITISDIAENDGRAFFVMTLKNDLLRTLGIDEEKYSLIFKIDDGKIENISGGATNKTEIKLKTFQNAFMLWAARKKLDVLNEIMPNGNLVYNATNAKKYLALVTEWKRDNNPSFVKIPTEKKTTPNNQ